MLLYIVCGLNAPVTEHSKLKVVMTPFIIPETKERTFSRLSSCAGFFSETKP